MIAIKEEIKNVNFDTDFVFITSSYNQSKFIKKSLNSIKAQKYPRNKFRIIYIDDASTDSTFKICREFKVENPDINITIIKNEKNMGPAYSRHIGYHKCTNREVCVFLDGDDSLVDKNTLGILSYIYKAHKVDATFGSYIQGGKWQFDMWVEYDRKTWKGHDANFFPHLRTAKAKICKLVPEYYLKCNKKWFRFMTDSALFTAVCELCNNNYAFIPNLLVDYSNENSETNKETGHKASLKNIEQRALRKIYSDYLRDLTPLNKKIVKDEINNFKPKNNDKRDKFVIIVPYRNREEHLAVFVPYMQNFLGTKYDYEIIIIEQCDNKPFNRAKLMNIGFDVAKEKYEFFCFHDVDLLPINQSKYNEVKCPTHLCAKIDYYDWKPLYEKAFGGVTMFPKKDFIKVNGFSNVFWGWGCEDDEMLERCIKEKCRVERRWNEYKGIPHIKENKNAPEVQKNRKKLYAARDNNNLDYRQDGLNSLKYKILSKTRYVSPNYTLVKVQI